LGRVCFFPMENKLCCFLLKVILNPNPSFGKQPNYQLLLS